ncbi:substrate-binding domain-containing protein [Bifidobacterium sp. 82T24]|uniref:substrate-binding domain-containing protein n=1 Tax=Bifidobacterium pluvialisilvae TaxID=2834436 RepID=UPI001C57A573|nr:substrate-binding domain-containing protein [Bifidobacterium pluvialisilvae]MBW3087341.1 substrate-binding domain-containing protein [Bifidobacterium pluvialisilvae]
MTMRRAVRMLAGLLAAAMVLPLAGCMPKDKAVGDTQETPEAIAHDGVDRHDIGVGFVGSARPGNAKRDASVLRSMRANDMQPFYAASNDDAGSQQKAVEGFVQRDVKVIVISVDGASGWQDVLDEARRAGIPVVLLESSITPDDRTLYAARFHIVPKDSTPKGGAYGIDDALMTIIDDKPHDKDMNVMLTGALE